MKKKIIIVGAGFAGLSALLVLSKKKQLFDIKLIDKGEFFEYTPSLHLCLDNPGYVEKIRFRLKKYYPEYYVKGEVVKIEKGKVFTKKTSYDFDYLIIATGSKTNFYGLKGFESNSCPVKRIRDIEAINSRLKRGMDVTVVGGGYTGVEIATVLAERKRFNVTLIHAEKHLLSTLDKNAGKKAEHFLNKYGATVLKEKLAHQCTKKSVKLKTGEKIGSDMVIMSAGIRLVEMTDNKLNEDLSLKRNKNIFLCGDIARSGNLATAHNAMIEGRLAANNIISRFTQKQVIRHNHDWKILAVALGRHRGMITFGRHTIPVPFTGFLKWIVERRVMFEFRNKIMLPI